MHLFGASNFGCISYQSTYLDAYGNDRRCWMLNEDDTIQLCAGYSEKVRWYVVSWLRALREYYRQREEENLRVVLEHSDKVEEELRRISFEIQSIVGREFDKTELNSTEVSRFIRENMFPYLNVHTDEVIFSPSVIDFNQILYRMGLIGYRTSMNEKRPNSGSVQQKFYELYPGVPLAQPFGDAMKFNIKELAFVQLLLDMKQYSAKNGIGCK